MLISPNSEYSQRIQANNPTNTNNVNQTKRDVASWFGKS